MLDLFNEHNLIKENFDSNTYLRNLCDGTKVKIYSCVNAKFPPGWKDIVNVLIKSIKNYPVSISRIHDTYSVLDVNFDIEKSSREVYVWRAIDKARTASAKTCGRCGREKVLRRRDSMEKLCDYCLNSLEKNGMTQTWLDKF